LIIAIRFALYADMTALAGLVAFSLYALRPNERVDGVLPLVRPVIWLSSGGLALSGLGMVALVANMMGTPLREFDAAAFRSIVQQTAIGIAWVVRIAALCVAFAAAPFLARWPTGARVTVLLASAVAIATLVWAGHAGAAEGRAGIVQKLSDIAHMWAAAIWIGGLTAFTWLLSRPAAKRTTWMLAVAHRALHRFSRVGTAVVAVLVITGTVNGTMILGFPSIHELIGSTYVRLLIAKLALFACMLALAGANRWRLTPALGDAIQRGDPANAVRALRKSLIMETAAAAAILYLVAWFATLEPLPIS